MITCIREVRRARGLTLQDVADRCDPPTTAQTIGRLETGTRTVSVGWLNRIAAALGVTASDLVTLPRATICRVVALLGPAGADAPRRVATAAPPQRQPRARSRSASPPASAIIAPATRSGATGSAPRISPPRSTATCSCPRAAGRLLFGRLIGREPGRLHLLPLGPGSAPAGRRRSAVGRRRHPPRREISLDRRCPLNGMAARPVARYSKLGHRPDRSPKIGRPPPSWHPAALPTGPLLQPR